MRLLPDTHAIIWHYENRPLLTDVAIQAIEDPASKVFISVASLWEMTVKVEIGKLNLGGPVRTIMTTYV